MTYDLGPSARRAIHLGGGPVGGGAVGLDNLPIPVFDIRLTTASGKDIGVFVDALQQVIPVSMEAAARGMADKLVAQAKADWTGTGLRRSAKLRPGAVHMQDYLFPRYPEPGDAEATFGVYTTPPAWHTEYHEHGTFGQRKLPAGFMRQYRARRGGKIQATAASAKPSGLEQVQGRRPPMRGRLGVRATHWLTNSVGSQIAPYLQAVERGMAAYLRAVDGGATDADATRRGLSTTARSLGKSGLATVTTSAQRLRLDEVL